MDNANDNTPINYALNGKIMLSSVIILFIVVCVVVCFHTYARCCSTRAHHRQRRRQRRPRQQLNNPSSANNYNATVNISSSQVSMDPRMLKTLPIFVYSSTAATAATAAALECTVCLSEFQNGERGRTLPKCGHAFHVACVDEWFLSHSNCPLCRAPVQPDNIVVVADQPETSSAGVVITVIEDPASVSETRDSTGLYCSFPMADFQPEWCPRKAEGLVGLAAGSDLERNRCKPLSRGFGVCSTNTMR